MTGQGGRKSTDRQNKDAPHVNPEKSGIRSSIPITLATPSASVTRRTFHVRRASGNNCSAARGGGTVIDFPSSPGCIS